MLAAAGSGYLSLGQLIREDTLAENPALHRDDLIHYTSG
jgi:hypothetical protein